MTQVRSALVSTGMGLCDGWQMWCPGCEDIHAVSSEWEFDGNVESPTFSPSILVQYGTRPGDRRCHSFVRAGQWQFLSDSTHALAGQTVAMVAIP